MAYAYVNNYHKTIIIKDDFNPHSSADYTIKDVNYSINDTLITLTGEEYVSEYFFGDTSVSSIYDEFGDVPLEEFYDTYLLSRLLTIISNYKLSNKDYYVGGTVLMSKTKPIKIIVNLLEYILKIG